MSSANSAPNLLGKICALKGDHNIKKLQEYMRRLNLHAKTQSYENICSALRGYCIRENINTEAQLELHINSKSLQVPAAAQPPQPPQVVVQPPAPPREYSNLDILFNTNLDELLNDTESFRNLNNYTRNVRAIGDNSRNGFIRELTYLSGGGNRYTIILKNAANSEADSLLYEYLVGLCINEFAKYFPCFPKTYMIGNYNTIADLTRFRNIGGLQTLPSNFNTYITKLDTGDLSTAIKNGCENNGSLCVFTQYIPIEYSFHHFMGSMCLPARVEIMAQFSARLCKLGAILHIMYAVLSSLANYFTHYDLHHDNLVLVKAPVNQYIQLRLHLQNGQIVEYKTSYMPVFIDFGHSFVNCTNLNAAIHDSDTIIKTTCRHDQTNQDINQAKCLDNCGDNTGYNWNPNFNYATGTFNPQTAQRYYIDPTRHNISHDIKFLVNLRDNYDYSNVAGVGYMGRTLVSDFLLTKLIPPDTQYGSRENLSMNNDHVYNVHSAFNLLNNIVADPEFNIANNLLYAGQTLYKTIDIWHGQPIAGHQFTSI